MIDYLWEYIRRTIATIYVIIGAIITGATLVGIAVAREDILPALPWLMTALVVVIAVSGFFTFQEERRKTQTLSLGSLLSFEQVSIPARRPAVGRTLALRLVNDTDRDIQECTVRLIKIWQKANVSWRSNATFEPLYLAWSPANGAEGITIGAKSSETFLLVTYEGTVPDLPTHANIVTADKELRAREALQQNTWRAECEIKASDLLPLKLEVIFIWGSVPDRSTPWLRVLEFKDVNSIQPVA